MPVTMTATWMGLGAVLIVLFLVVGALLPRPFSETPPWNPTRAITPDRKASDYAMNRDSGAKGEGRSGEQATKGQGEATGKGGEPGAKGKDGEAKKGSGEEEGKNGGGARRTHATTYRCRAGGGRGRAGRIARDVQLILEPVRRRDGRRAVAGGTGPVQLRGPGGLGGRPGRAAATGRDGPGVRGPIG